jgi:hypothetical protein
VKLRLEREEGGRCSLSNPRPLRDLVGDEDFLGEERCGERGRDEAESLRLCLGGDGNPSPSAEAFFDLSRDFEKNFGSTIWTSLWQTAGTKNAPVELDFEFWGSLGGIPIPLSADLLESPSTSILISWKRTTNERARP